MRISASMSQRACSVFGCRESGFVESNLRLGHARAIRSSASDSEFRAATEAELLNLVVRLLRERERVVEPQRPERRFPNHADADRAANMHAVIDRARRRIGNARAPGWTDTTRNNLASGGECRRAGVVP